MIQKPMRRLMPRKPTPLSDFQDDMAVAQRQLHEKLELGKGIYIGDMDKMLETVEKQMPIVNSEQIYLWELEKGERIYIALAVIGLLLIALGFLI